MSGSIIARSGLFWDTSTGATVGSDLQNAIVSLEAAESTSLAALTTANTAAASATTAANAATAASATALSAITSSAATNIATLNASVAAATATVAAAAASVSGAAASATAAASSATTAASSATSATTSASGAATSATAAATSASSMAASVTAAGASATSAAASAAGAAAAVSSTAITASGSTTARTLPVRAADVINVKDFGATLDGVAFDNTPFNNARIAAGDHSMISVPAGGWRVNATPTGGSTGPVLWKLSGNCFTTGTTPVAGLGTDTVESFVAGSRYVGRTGTVADMSPVFRLDSTTNHSGGTSGNVIPTLKVNSTIPANASALNNYVWGITSLLTSAATGPGQHMAVSGQSTRITGGTSMILGGNFYATDTTGSASSATGALVGAELDCNADGLDDGGIGSGTVPNGQGIRVGLDISLSRVGVSGSPALAHVGWGVRVGGGNGDQTAIQVERAFAAVGLTGKAGFTTEFAVMATGANAFRMAAGQTFALDAAGVHTLSYDTASGKMFYAVSGVNKFSVDASGNARFAGTVTGSVTP